MQKIKIVNGGKMIKTIKILSVIVVLFASQIFAQPTVGIATVTGAAPSTVTLPVHVADFNGVASFALRFEYDSTRLGFNPATGVTNRRAELGAAGTFISVSVINVPATSRRQVIVYWEYDLTTTMNIPGGSSGAKLFDLVFSYLAGPNASVNFASNSVVEGIAGSLSARFVNGGVNTMQAQIGAQAPVASGVSVGLPVTVVGFNNVASFLFRMEYDTTRISFNPLTGVINRIAALNAPSTFTSVTTVNVPATTRREILFYWEYDLTSLLNVPSGKLFDLQFLTLSTSPASVTFRPGTIVEGLVPPSFSVNLINGGVNVNSIPVELTSFKAAVIGNVVNISWTTATERNNLGFEIEKSSGNNVWNKIGFVNGNGTTVQPQSYSFTDRVVPGTFSYRLKQVDFDGQFEYSSIIQVNVGNPETFSLNQNYPNPFNPTTNISFSIPQSGFVKLSVFNLLGQEVARLVDGTMQAGFHNVTFKAENLNTGVYIYKLEANDLVQTKKMTLLK